MTEARSPITINIDPALGKEIQEFNQKLLHKERHMKKELEEEFNKKLSEKEYIMREHLEKEFEEKKHEIKEEIEKSLHRTFR